LRIVAFDIGSKYTGYALTDPTGKVPVRSGVIEGDPEKLLEKITEIIREYEVKKVVVGIPLTLKGSDSEQTKKVKLLAKKLRSVLDVPVFEFDERLTTVEAQKLLREMGLSQRRRIILNEIAARLILENFIKSEESREG
jgi:putative Holliday junction resolvase